MYCTDYYAVNGRGIIGSDVVRFLQAALAMVYFENTSSMLGLMAHIESTSIRVQDN